MTCPAREANRSSEYRGMPRHAEVMKQVVVFDKGGISYSGKDRPAPKVLVLRCSIRSTDHDYGRSPRIQGWSAQGQKRHGIYELVGNQLKMYGSRQDEAVEFKAPPTAVCFLDGRSDARTI